FTVQEIREYIRRLGKQDFTFTDYALRGVNAKTFDAEQVMAVRLRMLPNAAGAQDGLLLRMYDEFAFAENFLMVLNDPGGHFQVKDAGADEPDYFRRINEVRGAYEAAVLVVSETT